MDWKTMTVEAPSLWMDQTFLVMPQKSKTLTLVGLKMDLFCKAVGYQMAPQHSLYRVEQESGTKTPCFDVHGLGETDKQRMKNVDCPRSVKKASHGVQSTKIVTGTGMFTWIVRKFYTCVARRVVKDLNRHT
jgi:hypothetical protein